VNNEYRTPTDNIGTGKEFRMMKDGGGEEQYLDSRLLGGWQPLSEHSERSGWYSMGENILLKQWPGFFVNSERLVNTIHPTIIT